jgi:hypothetical protein
MRTTQAVWTPEGWSALATEPRPPDLVLVFGGREALQSGKPLGALSHTYPPERVFGCSTAGEIAGTRVQDDSAVATAVWLDRARVVPVEASLSEAGTPFEVGRLLGQRLAAQADLVHTFLLSDGTCINGSELVRGLAASLPASVTVSGGLSGDGARMQETVVCHQGRLQHGTVTALGFCGPVQVGIGSLGGWDTFGPVRQVSRSVGNVLYELDREPALALYKRYLGPHAAGLPASGLLFPLQVQVPGDDLPLVRTLLGVDEATGSMTFAGDVPQGASAQLMRSNVDRLVGGASAAAAASRASAQARLALLVSCVGRKLVLKQRVEEEVEAVAEVLGPDVTLTGFYSYGEVAPHTAGGPCRLHNQTMTVTTLGEL